jgi:hypothetical protein
LLTSRFDGLKIMGLQVSQTFDVETRRQSIFRVRNITVASSKKSPIEPANSA